MNTLDSFINFLDRLNSDNTNISDVTIDDYEYLDTYIFDDYCNYSDSKELKEKLLKMFDKYILHFDSEEFEFACILSLPVEFHIYILEKYGMKMKDCVGLYIRLADGPENMDVIIEILVKNNIIVNKNSLENHIDEIKEYMENGYFDIDTKDIEKYLNNYDL